MAFGKQTQRFEVVELAQAHGALQSSLADLEILDGGVDEDRESLDHRRVQSSPAETYGGGASSSSGGFHGGGLDAAAKVDGEEAHGEEGKDEEDTEERH